MKSERMQGSAKAETWSKTDEGARAEAASKESLEDAAFIFNEQVWADLLEAIGGDELDAFAFDDDFGEGE